MLIFYQSNVKADTSSLFPSLLRSFGIIFSNTPAIHSISGIAQFQQLIKYQINKQNKS